MVSVWPSHFLIGSLVLILDPSGLRVHITAVITQRRVAVVTIPSSYWVGPRVESQPCSRYSVQKS
jgi:hypothetical protein